MVTDENPIIVPVAKSVAVAPATARICTGQESQNTTIKTCHTLLLLGGCLMFVELLKEKSYHFLLGTKT
jgi:hypothetical protein